MTKSAHVFASLCPSKIAGYSGPHAYVSVANYLYVVAVLQQFAVPLHPRVPARALHDALLPDQDAVYTHHSRYLPAWEHLDRLIAQSNARVVPRENKLPVALSCIVVNANEADSRLFIATCAHARSIAEQQAVHVALRHGDVHKSNRTRTQTRPAHLVEVLCT